MNPSPRRRWKWIALLAAALIGLPLFFFFWFAPPHENLPVEVFLPARMAGAVRLHGLQGAWARHWQARARHLAAGAPAGTPALAPEDALRALLDAAETWPKWVKKYGETQARLRLSLYQSALFQALGEDAWLIFGEWGGPATALASPAATGHAPTLAAGQPEVGLVMLLRGTGKVGKRLGPLLKLAFGDYKIERTSHAGVPIYEYKDPRLGRCLSLCQMGGWIVASWRQGGTGPLPQMIDQAKALARRDGSAPPQAAAAAARLGPLLADGQTTPSAISLAFNPDVLWAEYRQFQLQRQRKISASTEDSLKFWQQRLQGVQQATLAQAGESLFDWRLRLSGEGPQRWYSVWQQEARSTTTLGLGSASTTATAGTLRNLNLLSAVPPAVARPELLQLDLDLPLARMLLPLAGYDWETLLEGATPLELIAPGLRQQLSQRLTAWAQPAEGRMGLAAYAGSAPLFPDVLGWFDLPPLARQPAAPAAAWRALAADRAKLGPHDEAFWLRFPFGAAGAAVPPQDALAARQWQAFASGVWNTPPPQPPGFLAVNFAEFARALEAIPEIMLKKNGRKALRKWRRTAEALEVAFGAAALRIDPTPAAWDVALRTD